MVSKEKKWGDLIFSSHWKLESWSPGLWCSMVMW